MKFYLLLHLISFLVLTCSCQENSPTEKWQRNRNDILNVQNRIVGIPMEEVLIGSTAKLCLLDSILIIGDGRGYDKLIHLFNKNTFKHLASTATLGQGQNEITRLGQICPNEKEREFYVFDSGKQRLHSFNIDSLLNDSNYVFTNKAKLHGKIYPSFCHYITDTFSIVKLLDFSKGKGASEICGSWNMTTGEFVAGYKHPIAQKGSLRTAAYEFTGSKEDSIYVMCSRFHDLMTICNIDGTLRCNVYGPNWNEDMPKTRKYHYNMDVEIGGNKIFALYSGKELRPPKEGYPTKILIFDTNGNYLKTLETGYQILKLCYDDEHHRLILFTYNEMQFGYLDLEGII